MVGQLGRVVRPGLVPGGVTVVRVSRDGRAPVGGDRTVELWKLMRVDIRLASRENRKEKKGEELKSRKKKKKV